jgi:hypothetical protein
MGGLLLLYWHQVMDLFHLASDVGTIPWQCCEALVSDPAEGEVSKEGNQWPRVAHRNVCEMWKLYETMKGCCGVQKNCPWGANETTWKQTKLTERIKVRMNVMKEPNETEYISKWKEWNDWRNETTKKDVKQMKHTNGHERKRNKPTRNWSETKRNRVKWNDRLRWDDIQ